MIPTGAKGVLEIPLTKYRYFTVVGGPYRACPNTMHGVKMAREVAAACTVDIPTADYQVPDRKVLLAGLKKAVDLLLAGEPLYVGCMGGMGRTGLFLAVLAKAFKVPYPVEYVRSKYYAHAVETKEQYEFVMKFPIPPQIYTAIKKARKRSYRVNLTKPVRTVFEQYQGVIPGPKQEVWDKVVGQ